MWDVGYEINELRNLGRQISVVDFAFQNRPKDCRPSGEFPVLQFAIVLRTPTLWAGSQFRNPKFEIISLCPLPHALCSMPCTLRPCEMRTNQLGLALFFALR